MIGFTRWVVLAGVAACLACFHVRAQIDPVKRDLFQFGYNGALEGHPPIAVYAFYYRNQPSFLERSNLTLRLAVAPTYLDSELGISGALGENTDIGIGVGGGGFADSYYEIRQTGKGQSQYLPSESFDGYSGEASLSVYHLFNPGSQIPLYGMVRGIAHYSFYGKTEDTAHDFTLPDDHGTFSVRTGLRWGGKEPTLFPALAMELSAWYEGVFRTDSGSYGFSGDRHFEPQSHLFWCEALLAYTFPELKHSFYVNLTAGTSLEPDRFSAYRLGALLPLVSEFPLSLPGYYYQEISARKFFLMGGNYILPVDKNQRFNLSVNATTAVIDYLPGLEQEGSWRSGVGGGVFYASPTWRVMVGYAYGIDALRSSGHGAHSIGILLQLDLAHAKEAFFKPDSGSTWRGLQRVLGVLGS